MKKNKNRLAGLALALLATSPAFAVCTSNCQFKLVIPGIRAAGGAVTFVADSGTGALRYSDGTYAASCQGYLQPANPSYPPATTSGIYTIRAGGSALPVYCNQTFNGGGWTLLMKQANGDGATLKGDTTYWTDGTTLNDTVASQNTNDGNFVSAAFAGMPVTQFMLQAANETTVQTYSPGVSETALVAFSTANRSYYTDPVGVPTTIPNWFISTSTYPIGYTISQARLGFNFMEGSTTYVCSSGTICDTNSCGVRWGWAANNDLPATAAGTDDACGGLGAYGTSYGGNAMNHSMNVWQPATLYLWAK